MRFKVVGVHGTAGYGESGCYVPVVVEHEEETPWINTMPVISNDYYTFREEPVPESVWDELVEQEFPLVLMDRRVGVGGTDINIRVFRLNLEDSDFLTEWVVDPGDGLYQCNTFPWFAAFGQAVEGKWFEMVEVWPNIS